MLNDSEIALKLLYHLREELNDSKLEYEIKPTKLMGGNETLTYLFKLSSRQKPYDQCLVLRLYPEYVGADTVVMDSCVQSILADMGYPVAGVFLTHSDKSLLGGSFFIMRFMMGSPMITMPDKHIYDLLAKTHASLHQADPKPLERMLDEQGIDRNLYNSNALFNIFTDLPKDLSYFREVSEWVVDNRKPDFESHSICHGDFHPNNILILDGQVSGILDWHLTIADPAYDVARTIQILSLFHKIYVPESYWSQLEINTQKYLSAYKSIIPLEDSKIMYCRVVFCILCLLLGYMGNKFLRYPLFVKEQIEFVYEKTKISLPIPDWV